MTRKPIDALRVVSVSALTAPRARRVAILIAMLLGGASLYLASSARHEAKTEVRNPSIPARPAPLPTVAPAGTEEPPRVVRFNLYDLGIYPREVHVDKGRIAVTIEDYSGGTPGLAIESEGDPVPQQVGRVDRSSADWRVTTVLKLGPGRYQVYMLDRPANRALLVVEP